MRSVKHNSVERGPQNSGRAIDVLRDSYHTNWIQQEDLGQMLTAQAYRPEIIEAIHQIYDAAPCEKLEKVCQGNIIPGQGPRYGQTGVPCLKTKNVRAILVEGESEQFVSDAYASSNPHLRVPCNSVLMNLSGAGSIGRVGIYLGNERPFTNQHIVRFMVAPPIDAAFVAAYFSTWYGERAIEQGISGSTGQLWINQDQIRELPVPLPSEEIQRAIGYKVRKAERLRAISKTTRHSLSQVISEMFGDLSMSEVVESCWVGADELGTRRLDAWFHRPFYLELAHRLSQRSDFIPVKQLCQIVKKRADFKNWQSELFDYFEISRIEPQTGEAFASETLVAEAPSRATTLIEGGDILISTVRPNLKAVGQISPLKGSAGVATSGFCVMRAETPAIGAYVRACLVQAAGTHQLMRWNSGGTYPAIEHSVPSEVLIPNPGTDEIERMGGDLLEALLQVGEARDLIDSAKADIEALIEGGLDSDSLLSEGENIKLWLDKKVNFDTAEIN